MNQALESQLGEGRTRVFTRFTSARSCSRAHWIPKDTVLEALAGDCECMLWVQKSSGCPGGPQTRALGLKWPRTHRRRTSGPVPGPLVGGWFRGDCSPYLQNQLPGRRGHENAVAPRGASGVHVPLALAGLLAVRVAGRIQGRLVSGRQRPHLPLSPEAPGRAVWLFPRTQSGQRQVGKKTT